MALSTIVAQTPLGGTLPNGIKTAIQTSCRPPADAPNGYGVIVAGMLTGANPGDYIMIFGYQTPAGTRVDERHSGSTKSAPSGGFDQMLITTVNDPSVRTAQIEYWEVWFKTDEVNGTGWNTKVQVVVAGTQYPYTLAKKRTHMDLAGEAKVNAVEGTV